jgi:hypothetical protein
LSHDIDKVILFGGTTKIPFVMEQLKQIFGASKVISASELMLSGESASFGELELTGVALGASCSLDPQFSAFYVNRIPCRLILSTKQGSQIQECEYSPFSRLPLYPATTPFVSNALELQNNLAAQYKIVMEDVDDVILYDTGWKDAKMPTYGAPARKMRIILDRFGRVFPQMITGNNDMVTEMLQPKDWIPQMDAPPWQTPDHREALNKLMDHLLQFQKTEYERLVFMVHRNPWGWGEDVG